MIEDLPNLKFLSELYCEDAADAYLLAEYPSSNSTETVLQNRQRFIIHDPFPPPPPELIKQLGPHHLMCGWGDSVPVTSQVAPDAQLLDHWDRQLGPGSCPQWHALDLAAERNYITLFPLESVPPHRQVVDPQVNYHLHSKAVIADMDCAQADVFSEIRFPCIVKLSHGYAGLGNYLLRDSDDQQVMQAKLNQHWPDAKCVINSVIQNVVGDYGVQFYLRRNGQIVWLGFTEQHFDENKRWCGGAYSAAAQTLLRPHFESIVQAAGSYLHSQSYFGVVGVDILQDNQGQCFLVDVNPRLTGVSPFLMASRQFKNEGYDQGIYQASGRFPGTLNQLIAVAEKISDAKVLVLSACQQKPVTVCHLSVSSNSQERNQQILQQVMAGP